MTCQSGFMTDLRELGFIYCIYDKDNKTLMRGSRVVEC